MAAFSSVEDALREFHSGDHEARASEVFEVEGMKVVLSEAYFTVEECRKFVDAIDSDGEFRPVSDSGYLDQHRLCDRRRIVDSVFSEELWERSRSLIEEHFPEIHVTEDEVERLAASRGCIGGPWRACGISEEIRLIKYGPSGHFAPHFDMTKGPVANEDGSQDATMLTFMIYLNGTEAELSEGIETFEGGPTKILKQSTKIDYSKDVDRVKESEDDVLREITPKQPGTLILFRHGTVLHTGGLVTKGHKYLLRSDVIFRKF